MTHAAPSNETLHDLCVNIVEGLCSWSIASGWGWLLLWNWRRHCFATVNDDLLVYFFFGISVFEALPSRDPSNVCIDFKHSDTANISVIATVATESYTTSVAQPEGGFLVFAFGRNNTIIVAMVTEDS